MGGGGGVARRKLTLEDDARTRLRKNFIIKQLLTESHTGSWFDTSTMSPSSELPDAELSDEAELRRRRRCGLGREGWGCVGRIRAPPGAGPEGAAPPPEPTSQTYLGGGE